MYIKQIIIQGFKSYKEQTVMEEFSPQTNIIVGRNGSGKSNFFAAIRFVLSDAYTQMGREERQALLHEGSGSAVMSAYVEIIFDNSDDRFPTGKDELILRRTIGLKKDEYSLDRKNATKADVMNLLESAGFSRSNPYYIVPQGRVTTLTNMKDAERLNLLKEVAGTQVYEARRSESLKIMTETNNKRAKIDELLEYIKERLSELEEEKEELRGYQEKDKERRCLEYTYYHRDQIDISNKLDQIDEARQEGIEGNDDNQEAFVDGERIILELQAEITELSRQMELLKIERRQLEEDKRDAMKTRAQVELGVKKLIDNQSATDQTRQQHDRELRAVREEIARKEAELSNLLPDYIARRETEIAVKTRLDAADASRQRIHAKEGRGKQYRNKAERDAFLRREIDEINSTIALQRANRIDADEQYNNIQGEITTLEADIAGLRDRLEGWGGSRQALAEAVQSAKDALSSVSEERKQLLREGDKLESNISSARQEVERSERDLAHAMDGSTARGLATIRRLKRERNLTGAYGTLAELFEVNETYRVAAEVTAGNSLFHYVVDNAETATMLADILHRDRSGRITFVPLDQLRIRPANLPNTPHAVPLISKLKYDARYEKAFQQVFGKTVVCPNLVIAGEYARSHGVNTITTDGDTQNKKGAITGGFIDSRRSRLAIVRTLEKWRDEYDGFRTRLSELKAESERKEQEITAAKAEVQKLEQRLRHQDDSFDPLKIELRSKSLHLDRQKELLEHAGRRRDAIVTMLANLGEQLSSLEAERSSRFEKNLTAAEEHELERLNSEVEELRRQWNDLSSNRRELESRKNLLEVDLRENLLPKLDQLNSQEVDLTVGAGSSNLQAARRELKRISKTVDELESKLQENEQEIEAAETKINAIQNDKFNRERQQEEIAKSIERFQRKMERSIQSKAGLMARAAECAKNIRDLGVLPEEAFERFENTELSTVLKRLKKVNEALKKYKHVNKKAFEQYNNFTNQRDTLTKRRKELDSSQASIEELVQVLDQRKDEAIERTFKQVSREFARIFERLVPAGKGRLIIQRRADGRAEESEEEGVENYTGVGISVSFNSKHDEQQRIQQLSGGQKSLCALALVFAIQQCDPAPFYLFDEIDANLDAQYRTAVAQMLQSISEQQGSQDEQGGMQGQFICTTFRPEMVLVADKCYGVTFRNKTSSIDVVEREQALEFVDGQKQ